MHHPLLFRRNGFSPDQFQEQEDQSSSIQSGKRKKVDDPQIDCEQGRKTQKSQDHCSGAVGGSLRISVIHYFDNTHRSGDIVFGKMPPENETQRFVSRFQPVKGLIKTILKDLDGIALHILSGTPDSNIIAVILFVQNGSQFDRILFAVPFIGDAEGFSVIHHGDKGDLPVDVNGLAVDFFDHITLFQSRLHGGRIGNDFLDHGKIGPRERDQDDGKDKTQDKVCHGSGEDRGDPAADRRVGE